MNKFLLLLIPILLISCNEQPFTGYCVGKKKLKGHLSDQEGRIIKYAVIVPHVPMIRKSKPTWVKTSYQVAIANYDTHKIKNVDSITFFRMKLGEKYTFKN